MRNSQRNQIEQQLTFELKRVEAPYRHALEIVESVPEDSAPDYHEILDCMTRLQPVMQHINRAEETLAPLRREWHAFAVRPGRDLRSILDVHEQLLRQLISRIDDMEHQLTQMKQNLAPAVDAQVRQQRMKRAYGR